MDIRNPSDPTQNAKEGVQRENMNGNQSTTVDSGMGESSSANASPSKVVDERDAFQGSRPNHSDNHGSSSSSTRRNDASGNHDGILDTGISIPSNGALTERGRVASRGRTEGGAATSTSSISNSTMPASNNVLPAGLAAAEASFNQDATPLESSSSAPFSLGRRSGSNSPTPLNSHPQSSSSHPSSNLGTEILPPPPRLPYDHRYPPLAPKLDAEVGAVTNSTGSATGGGGQGIGSGNANPKKRSAPTQIDRRTAAPTPKGSLPLGIRIALGKDSSEIGGKGNKKLTGSKSDNSSRLGSFVDVAGAEDRAASPSSSSSLADTNTALGAEDEKNGTVNGDMPSSSPFASGAGSATSSPAFQHQPLPRLGSDAPAAAEGEDADVSMTSYDQSFAIREGSNEDLDETMEDGTAREGSSTSKTPSKPRRRARRSGLTPSPTSKLPSGLTSEPGKRGARARNPQFSYYAPIELSRREKEKDVRREQGLPSATPDPTKAPFYTPDENGIVDVSPSPPAGASLLDEEGGASSSSHLPPGSAKRPRLVLKKKGENGSLPFAAGLDGEASGTIRDERETSSEGLIPATLAAAASEGGSTLIRTSPMKPGLGMLGGFQGSTQVHVAGGRLDENRAPNNEFCETCKGIGHFICCDGCPRSFHFACVNPPLDIDELPASSKRNGDTDTHGEEPWYCKVCQNNKKKQAKPSKGIFGHLLRHVENENPTVFNLPSDIRTFFKGVATATDGGYVNGRMIRGFRANKQGFVEERDPFKLKDSKSKAVLCYQCGESALPKGTDPESAFALLAASQDKGKGKQKENEMEEVSSLDPSQSHPGWRKILSCDFCSLHWHLDCVTPPVSGMPSMMRKWMCPNHVEHLQPSRRVPKASSQLQTIDLPVPTASNIGPGQTYKMRVRNDGDVDIIPDPLDEFFQDNGSGRALDSGWEDIARSGPRLRYRVPEKVVRTDFWMRIGADERTRMELNKLGGVFAPVENGSSWRPSSHQKSALDALADIAMVRLKADSVPAEEQKSSVSRQAIQAALGSSSFTSSPNGILSLETEEQGALKPPQEVGAPHPDEEALKIIAQRIPEYQAPVSTDRVILEDLNEEEAEKEENQRQREMELDSNGSLTDLSEDEDDHPRRMKRLPISGSSSHPNPTSTSDPTNLALTLRELAEQARLRAGHLPSSGRSHYDGSTAQSIGGISKDEIHQLRAVRDLLKNVGEKRLLEFLMEENSEGKALGS